VNGRIRFGGLLGLLLLVSACEMMDRVRGSAADTGGTGGITLNLETPGAVRAGEEAVFRLSVLNRGDTAITHMQAELFLPAWLQPLPPTQEGIVVTMVASGEGTRLSYRIADPPLQPGESRTVAQPVRVPPEHWEGVDISPSRTVRAWLSDARGQPLGVEVTSDIVVEGLQPAAADTLAEPGAAHTVGRDGVGGLRLGMSAAEVRQRFPAARDTTWSAEGMTERGLQVPLAEPADAREGGSVAVARLADGRIDQIRVRSPGPRTAEGLGVGSRLEELRAAYGPPCVSAEHGQVVVWFARQPGVSFVLDTAPPANPEALRRDPAYLPDSATVRELFVRGGADGC
jgi:hypothetical protein